VTREKYSLKICGMKEAENIRAVAALNPDYMGFIFYSKSPRYAGVLDTEVVGALSDTICKVGVFVNEPTSNVLAIATQYQLNAIQLHGNETPEECMILQKAGLTVIKALSVSNANDLTAATAYEESCNYLLFDTKTPLYGGSGRQYDWTILSLYQGQLPFFLSGGIGLEDAERVRNFSHPKLHAIDVNSRFETAPGLKNTSALELFIKETGQPLV
jgi:phosphoribosylanthranilate isomerase